MTPAARTMRVRPIVRTAPEPDAQRSIPFDYSFIFDLEGKPDRVVRSIVSVSVEASFTAVSIGYGVIPKVTPIIFGPDPITVNPPTLPTGQIGVSYNQTITQTGGISPIIFSLSAGALPDGLTLSPTGVLAGAPTVYGTFPIIIRATDANGSFGERPYTLIIVVELRPDPPPPAAALSLPSFRTITMGSLFDALERGLAQTPDVNEGETGPEAAFKGGIKLNPQFAELALLNDGKNPAPDVQTLQSLFQVVSAPSDEIQFLYALFDEGTGREFQSEPLLNIAGLGLSNGDRPFRYFARPIVFAPRSTIRMEVTEKSDFQGELHVSLHGYKVLGSPGTPTGRSQSPRRRARR